MALATFEEIWQKKEVPSFEDIWQPAVQPPVPSGIVSVPLTAEEIAEDKALEQRNMQMAFVREHPELIQQAQRKEEDQLIDDFFSKMPEPKTDYDRRLRLSNRALALKQTPDDYHRRTYLAKAKRAKIKELQEQGFIPDERRQYKGFWNELGRNTVGGGLNVASGLLGTLASVSEGAIWDKDKIEEWAQKLHEVSSKPAYTAAKEGGWKGFVGASIGQALPYMGAALASVLVTGQPYAAFGVGFSVEGDNAYRDALAAGASEEEAQLNRLIVGTINGAIEQIQISQIFKFAKAGKGSLMAISKAAQARAMKKIMKAGGKLTLESLYHAAREGLEEVLQETTSIAVEARVNPEVWNNATERILSAGLGGGVVGLAFGSAGAVRTAARPVISGLGLDKKSQQFKEFALSKEGSEMVAASAPEIAAKIAAKETPSRNDLKELGVSGWNAEERSQLASLFQDALTDQERMTSNQRAIEQAQEIMAWQQREAEEALEREVEGTAREEEIAAQREPEALREPSGEVPEAKAEKMVHTIRKMTPEEIAEDEAFWESFPEIMKGMKKVAERVPSLEALQDTLKDRIDLLEKVQLGILTQEEADALTEKFAEAAKLRIEAQPVVVEKEITDVEKEAITEPTPSPEVEPRKAGKIVPTGKLDPTNAKEALEIIRLHTQEGGGVGGIFEQKYDAKKARVVITSIEYTSKQVDTAYRTIQKPIESPMPDIDLFAMPGKEAQMKAIAQKMAKVKGVVKPKKKGLKALTKPTALPKAKTKKEDHIKAVYQASAKETERLAINGVKVEGDIIVATDGRRLFWAKGKWGKDGIYHDATSLKKGSLGKITKEKINFPKWRDIVPDVSDQKPILVNLEAALSHVRQAAILTTEESKGITIIENKDERLGLGFAAASPEVGHAEINVYEGGRILGALNPQYLLDVIKFHAIRGDTDIEFYFKNWDRPMLTKSLDGKTNTLTMPVNPGEPSEAIKKAISEWPTKAEPAAKPKSKGLKKKPAEPGEKAEKPKRIISKEAYEKARKRLIDPTKLRMGISPQEFADLVTIGAYHFESGVRKFTQWSAKMIEELGDRVRPHLQAVYDEIIARKKPKKGTRARKEFEAETRERGFITSVKETFPEMADRVAGQYIPRSTDKLSIEAINLIKNDIDAAEELARTGTDDKAVATASELIKHYNELAEATTDQAAEKTFYEKAANIAHPAAANLTELGRAVQAASILGRMTPEGQLRFAAKTINDYNEKGRKKFPKKLIGRKKIPGLTPEQTKEILEKTKAIEKMPDGEGKAKAFWEQQNYISELVPTPLWKKIINVWKAGLLTGIKTSGLNTFSNLAHGISEVTKDVPATGFDVMFSLVTKKRTIGLTLRGVPSGLKTGAARGWRYLKTGFDERNVAAKLDYHRVSMGKSKYAKAVGAYTDAIFRLMGAEDQPFYYGALARSLYSQAIANAKNKGLKGKEAKTFIENQVENPTDTMLNYAVQDALIAVYQNKTVLGKIGKKFQEMPVIGEVIAPFVRTPSAVAMQIINYSPVGVVKTVIENVGKGKFDQRLLSQGLARGLLGTGILYLGTQLFVMGLMALGHPKGERERKLWEIEGRKPNSIKVGGKWRDVQVLGPIGPVLLIGGYFQQALESTGSPTEAMVTAIFGGAKSFSEQTFVRGVNRAAMAVADPERSFELFFSSLAGSTVPTIISDIARTIDTKERRTRGPVQRIQVRIPGLRQRLEPRIDVFGNDLPRYGGNALEVMLDPTRPFKINEDVVVDELRRLWDNEYKVSPTQLGYKYGYEFLTIEENTQMWYAVGSLTYERLHRLIRLPEYKRASDEEKAKAIERAVDAAKEWTKNKMRIPQRKKAFEKESEK